MTPGQQAVIQAGAALDAAADLLAVARTDLIKLGTCDHPREYVKTWEWEHDYEKNDPFANTHTRAQCTMCLKEWDE